MKKILWWFVFILLCIWQLPQLIIAGLMLPFIGKPSQKIKRHYNFCFVVPKLPDGIGGISLGPVSYVLPQMNKADIAHELDGHTVDSKIWGPLYLFVIGFPSYIWSKVYLKKNKCYYDFYTERFANKHAGLEVDKYCNLKFKKKK